MKKQPTGLYTFRVLCTLEVSVAAESAGEAREKLEIDFSAARAQEDDGWTGETGGGGGLGVFLDIELVSGNLLGTLHPEPVPPDMVEVFDLDMPLKFTRLSLEVAPEEGEG